MHLKINDTVEVIAGDDRQQRGKVLSLDRKAGKLVVEGVNRVYKHVRRSQRNPQGGRLSKEMPIPVSNVMLICDSCGKPTRVGMRVSDDGRKERVCKRAECGASLGEVAPPKESR